MYVLCTKIVRYWFGEPEATSYIELILLTIKLNTYKTGKFEIYAHRKFKCDLIVKL